MDCLKVIIDFNLIIISKLSFFNFLDLLVFSLPLLTLFDCYSNSYFPLALVFKFINFLVLFLPSEIILKVYDVCLIVYQTFPLKLYAFPLNYHILSCTYYLIFFKDPCLFHF